MLNGLGELWSVCAFYKRIIIHTHWLSLGELMLLILTACLQGGSLSVLWSLFICMETESQKGFVTYPRLPSCYILDWDRDPGRLVSQSVPSAPEHRVINSPTLEKTEHFGCGKETHGPSFHAQRMQLPPKVNVFKQGHSHGQAHLQNHSCGHLLINNHDFCYISTP